MRLQQKAGQLLRSGWVSVVRDDCLGACKPPPSRPRKSPRCHALVMGFLGNISGQRAQAAKEGKAPP